MIQWTCHFLHVTCMNPVRNSITLHSCSSYQDHLLWSLPTRLQTHLSHVLSDVNPVPSSQ
ncbi:hypothetical protein NDU88_003787, partial [Pleurodeles waltl]